MKKTHLEIMHLALPATLENTIQASIGFVDTFIITRLGLLIVSAVSLANSILAVYLAIFIALSIASSSMVSRYIGAKEGEAVKDIASQSLIFAIIFGLVLTLLSVTLGKEILSFIGASRELLDKSYLFFSVVSLSLPFAAYATVGGALIRTTGDTKKSLYINGFSNIINIFVDLVLIFGLGPIPPLGVLGSAIGTSLSKVISAVLISSHLKSIDMNINFHNPFISNNTKEFLKLSLPSLIERVMMRVGQVVYFSLILSIGVNTNAEHMLVGNIETFNYVPAYGLATAVTVLVGKAIGKKDSKAAQMYHTESVKLGVIIMTSLGIVLFAGSNYLAAMFSDNFEVISRTIIALKIDAFMQPFLGISIIVSAALQVSGDTFTPLLATAVGIWVLRIAGIYLFSICLKMGYNGHLVHFTC